MKPQWLWKKCLNRSYDDEIISLFWSSVFHSAGVDIAVVVVDIGIVVFVAVVAAAVDLVGIGTVTEVAVVDGIVGIGVAAAVAVEYFQQKENPENSFFSYFRR